jgi:hypothetical protein
MTDSQQDTPHPPRPLSFQEDLLQDLKLTTSVPESPPRAPRIEVPGTPVADARKRTPAVELRVTPTHWSPVRLRQAADGQGMRLTAGPLAVSVELGRR